MKKTLSALFTTRTNGLLVACFTLLLFSCTQGLAGTTNVVIREFSFAPQTVSIQVGDTVVWTNAGGGIHTVTGDGADPLCGFGLVPFSCSKTFTNVGTFPYHCIIHQSFGVVGTVTVAATNTNGPPDNLLITSLALTQNGLALSFTGGTAPFSIQQKTDLASTIWTDVLTTTNFSAVVPVTNSAAFFRVVDHASGGP